MKLKYLVDKLFDFFLNLSQFLPKIGQLIILITNLYFFFQNIAIQKPIIEKIIFITTTERDFRKIWGKFFC
jgi:hypothetical protein